jgi:hypothetical protein
MARSILLGASLRRRTCRANSSDVVMFRKNHRHIRGIFGQISWRREPVGTTGVLMSELSRRINCRPRFDSQKQPENTSMVITAAHVQPIVALIAGIMILIMPRLLNFIVAIYLIFVGLVGFGLLRWLHL